MMNSTCRSLLCVAAFASCCAIPTTVTAQITSGPQQVISTDTYGLANERLTAEAEFCGAELSGAPLGCSLTVGLTATFQRHPRPDGSTASKQHADVEGFIRARDGGLTGPWVGLRTGLTYAERHGLRPSVGLDFGVSLLIARRIYAGPSVGVKKVFWLDDDSDLRYNPSFRFNAGYAF